VHAAKLIRGERLAHYVHGTHSDRWPPTDALGECDPPSEQR
jgi:hypothetical protein